MNVNYPAAKCRAVCLYRHPRTGRKGVISRIKQITMDHPKYRLPRNIPVFCVFKEDPNNK